MIKRLIFRSVLVACLVGLVACSGGEGRQADYFARAQQFFDEANYPKAQIEVKNVLQINPEHAEGRYLLALLFEQEQNWTDMFANLKMAIDLAPEHQKARIKYAQLLFIDNRYEEVLEQVDAVLLLAENNPAAHILLGSVLFRQDKPLEAIRQAELALVEEPGNVNAIALLSAIYGEENPDRALAVIGEGISLQTKNSTLKLLKIGLLEKENRVEEVVNVYKQLLADYPENLSFHYRLVRYHQQHGNVDAAESLLRDIVNTKPDNILVKLWLTQFLANNHSRAMAKTTLEQFVATQPEIVELRLALGQLYVASDDRDKAIELYRGVITEDDESADSLQARNKLALLYLTGDQREQADALLAEIFTIEPENVEALITNAKLLINEKQYTVAIANLRTVLRSQPDSVEGLLLLGQAYEKDGSSSLALDNYRRLLALDPSNQEALYSSAKMAIAQDEQASAEQLLKALLQKKPDHAEARRLLVSLLSKQQRWDEALNNVDVLLTNPTTLAAGYYLQGLVYSSQSDYPAAIESLQRALKEEPGIIEALSFLASAFTASNREKEGMDFLVNHVKNYPKHAHANELLGAYHHNNGRYAEALVSYRAAIALLPTRSSVYRRMGALHISQGQWQQAEETFQQGIDSIADNDGLYLLLAGVYSLTGDYQSARGVYESLLAERPGMQQVANNLAVILVDYMPSDENLRKALELTEPLRDSRSPAFLDTLGWVNFKLGNTSRALSLLETSVALGGNGPQYHYHLGMAYFRESQPEQARKHLEIAVSGNAEAYIGRDEAQLTLEAIRSAVPRG